MSLFGSSKHTHSFYARKDVLSIHNSEKIRENNKENSGIGEKESGTISDSNGFGAGGPGEL
jgi:hypothetical protein